MNKKSFRPCFIEILTLFVLCFLFIAPVFAQNNNTQKSLSDLYEEFEAAEKLPCGKRDEAIRIGKKIVEDFEYFTQLKAFIDYLKKRITIIEKADALCNENNSVAILFANFKKAKQAAGCDDSEVAVSVGKLIVEKFGDDKLNQPVIEYVRKQLPFIEEKGNSADYIN